MRRTFSLESSLRSDGRFEVLAITAGTGNGWVFPPDVLRRSLPLWDGIECFVDHSALPAGTGRSVRDLGGTFFNPAWDEARQGVRLELKTVGPCAALVESLGRELLAAGEFAPRVGFSADIAFTAREQQVERILRVYSVDLVYNPARGGAFIRSITQNEGEKHMDTIEESRETTLAVKEPLPEREALCAGLLESSLAAARLPAPLQEDLRRRFSGRVFQPDELAGAIEEGRALVSALTGPAAVQGPRIGAMVDTRDQLQAAVDDLLEAPREKGMETVKAARLSGIRELYMTLTGDFDLHGGYYAHSARLATTADFTGLVKNALNKVVANRWEELGRAGYDWWQRVSVVEHFNTLQQITGTLVGTVGSLPAVAEGGNYPELEIGDSPETASFQKYGGYIPLTLELIDRDETRKLRAYPRELAAAGLRKISSLVAGIFTAGNGLGPEMADGGALFNSDPPALAGGHANLGSAGLAAQAWEEACIAVYNQPMLLKNALGSYGAGPRMAINPRYLLVPRALQLAARKILYPGLENMTGINSENLQQGRPGDVITVPEWTGPSDWAAACDPLVAPAIFVGERFGIRPEVFIAGDETSPAVFINDEHRLKVRHFLAVWVNDYRPLYKSIAAG